MYGSRPLFIFSVSVFCGTLSPQLRMPFSAVLLTGAFRSNRKENKTRGFAQGAERRRKQYGRNVNSGFRLYEPSYNNTNDDIIKPSKRERTKVTIDRIELTFFISLPPFYILKNCAAHKGLAKYPLIMYNKKKGSGCKRQTFSGEYRSLIYVNFHYSALL